MIKIDEKIPVCNVLSWEGYMRSVQQQLGVLGTILALAFRHRKTKENLC
jgi:hypothetical protein